MIDSFKSKKKSFQKLYNKAIYIKGYIKYINSLYIKLTVYLILGILAE